MARKWDSRAKIPTESARQMLDWLNADLAAFQREHPKARQGRCDAMPARERDLLLVLYDRARNRAELQDAKAVSPGYYRAVKKLQRSHSVTIETPRPAKKRAPKRS